MDMIDVLYTLRRLAQEHSEFVHVVRNNFSDIHALIDQKNSFGYFSGMEPAPVPTYPPDVEGFYDDTGFI